MRLLILTAAIVLTAASSSLAQNFNSQPAMATSRSAFYADISGGGGIPVKSFNGDTHAALEAIGFDVTEGPNLIPARGITLFGEFNAGRTSRATIGALLSMSGGFLSGMRHFPDRSFAAVDASHVLTTVGFTPSVKPVSWLRIGGGPALCVKQLRLEPFDGQAIEMKDRSLGWVAKADIKIGDATGPSKFWHALVTYESAGQLSTGPATLIFPDTTHTMTWLPASINYSHWSIAVGYGMRFQ